MSSSEERLLILKMLQEGKITAEEAEKLLDALDGSKENETDNTAYKRQQKQVNFQDEIAKMRQRISEWGKEFKNSNSQKDFDHTIEEFVSKAEKFGKSVASTTIGIVDKVIDYVGSLIDTNAFNIFGSYNAVDKEYKVDAAEGMNVFIEGVNGQITLKKHEGNDIVIKSKIRSPQEDVSSILVYDRQDNTVLLKLNKQGNLSVAHEVLLPALKFNEIKVETTNGKILVEDAKCSSLEGITKNGNIDLMGVNAEKVNVQTTYARINISYMIGRNVDIITKNAVIDIKHLKVAGIKAVTKNGRINVENVQNYENETDIFLQLTTTNGGIKVNMNDSDNKGYKVSAKTTNGGINLLIPEMIYNNISKKETGLSYVEAISTGFQDFTNKITIEAETTNGFIDIVK